MVKKSQIARHNVENVTNLEVSPRTVGRKKKQYEEMLKAEEC